MPKISGHHEHLHHGKVSAVSVGCKYTQVILTNYLVSQNLKCNCHKIHMMCDCVYMLGVGGEMMNKNLKSANKQMY